MPPRLFLGLLASEHRDQEHGGDKEVWFEERCGAVAREQEDIYGGDIVSRSHRRAFSVSPNSRRKAAVCESLSLQKRYKQEPMMESVNRSYCGGLT